MPRGNAGHDAATLQMALVGYELEKQKIDDKIREIQIRLGHKRGRVGTAKKGAARKRVLSPAARARIAAAQRKRWAEHRKAAKKA
jgi:hypothetical protein